MKKRKIIFIIGAVIVVMLLLLFIHWDRIQYTKVLNDFYSGNHYLEIKARVPEEIRDRYYRERYETTEEEYKENSRISLVHEYKIRKVRNINRFNEIYNTESIGKMDMDTFRNTVHLTYGKYGIDPNLIEKAYVLDVREEIWTLAGIFVSERETHVCVYRYNGAWHVYASEAVDTVQTSSSSF